jgi:hypothetical protein
MDILSEELATARVILEDVQLDVGMNLLGATLLAFGAKGGSATSCPASCLPREPRADEGPWARMPR